MVYKLEDIRKDVRIVLDENDKSPELALALDRNTVSIDELIESKVEDAVTIVERLAPLHMLTRKKALENTTITWESEAGFGSGVIPLPKDFMRLVSFKMSDWRHSVTRPIYEDDPLYARQHSRYSGIRGTPQKPVVAVINTKDWIALEFFSCATSSAKVDKALYVPTPFLSAGVIDISQQCYRSVVYTMASLVASTYKDTELASSLINMCNNLLSINQG